MNDLLYSLRQSLHSLAERFPLLDDLLVPPQATISGESTGPSGPPGSKPPLALGMVDLKVEVEQVMGKWCGVVARSLIIMGAARVVKVPTDTVDRVQWVRDRAEDIQAMPWFERMTEEIIAVESLVSDVVDVPGISPWARDRLEVGTVREIVRWVRAAGLKTSRSTVQRWVASGDLPSERLPDDRVLVRFDDVMNHVRRAHLPDGPPRAVS